MWENKSCAKKLTEIISPALAQVKMVIDIFRDDTARPPRQALSRHENILCT